MKRNELFRVGETAEDEEFIIGGQAKKTPISIKIRLVIGIAAAVLVLALAVVLPSLLEAVVPPAAGQPSEASSTPPLNAVPASNEAMSVGVYAPDWKAATLQPNVAIQLNEYSPAQSDVPGLPFIISANSEELGQDSIRIDVDAGTLITWGTPDYSVKQRGKMYVLSSGDTIYWSPLDDTGKPIPKCSMTVTAYDSANQAYAVSVIISQTEDFKYSAEIKE